MLTLLWTLGCLGEPNFGEPDSFTVLYQEVLEPSCAFSSCHGGDAGSLSLSEEQSAWDELVDVDSVDAEGWIRVVPGDASESYLVAKMEGAADIEGDTMPPGQILDLEITQRVRAWIDAGALRD